MNIRELAFNLQNTYADMAKAFTDFQAKSGLPCLAGCGRCCLNPEIEASTLEMLPFAIKVYDEGKLDYWLSRMEELDQNFCALFEGDPNSGQGKCSQYLERPAICRMFGVAGTFDKKQMPQLSVCKHIREADPAKTKSIEQQIPSNEIPSIAQWYSQLSSMGDSQLQVKMPINLAIKSALEKLALYAQYQVI